MSRTHPALRPLRSNPLFPGGARRPGRVPFVPLLLLAALATLPAASAAEGIRIVKDDAGFEFSDEHGPILFYQIARKDQDGKAARSNYVHPLYDLDGKVLTEDFPADHIHHRGIFWAWHQVLVKGKRVQDQWSNANSFWEVQSASAAEGPRGVLRLLTHWESPLFFDENGDRVPFVREATRVVVHPREGNLRKIDFTVELRALVEGVQIGGSEDEKGYGGFSFRIRMPDDIRFADPKGTVTPGTNAVAASPWMSVTGSYHGGQKSGVVVLTHPDTTGFPQAWILRAKASMQNAVYPGRHPAPLSTTDATVLRYRLVLHRGELTTADLQRLQADYSRQPRS